MKKEIVNKMTQAFESYNLSTDSELPEKILSYLHERIEKNRAEIEKLISIYRINVDVNSILKIIKDEESKQLKSIGKTIIDKQGFMYAQVPMPVGMLVVRSNNIASTIKYWVRAIKTRNSVMVTSFQYNEYSLESLILIIIKEALSKFNVDKNLVMYSQAKNCSYEYFDRAIYTCNDQGKEYDEPEVIDISSNSASKNKKYVFIENENLKKYAIQNKNAELLTGDVDEVIEKVKNSEAVSIYTQDSKMAFKFINLARSNNIFVNADIQNTFDTISSNDEMYKYRNIIVPIPKELINIKENQKEEVIDNKTNNTTIQKETYESHKINNKKMMIEYKENLWQKIKSRFKELF